MNVDLAALAEGYEGFYDGNSIEYEDSAGEFKTDDDPRLTGISAAIQAREPPAISRGELINIGLWKSNRIGRHLRKNSEAEVKERTRAAFEEGDSSTAVEELMELTGVRVPVASAILTMFNPEAYAVIDYRVIRALGKVKPDLLGSGSYEAYAEFMEHFRSYGSRPQTYEFYMEHVDELCSDTGLTPREVDMGLWTLDKTGGATE